MKKIFSLLLAGSLLFSLAACNKMTDNPSQEPNPGGPPPAAQENQDNKDEQAKPAEENQDNKDGQAKPAEENQDNKDGQAKPAEENQGNKDGQAKPAAENQDDNKDGNIKPAEDKGAGSCTIIKIGNKEYTVHRQNANLNDWLTEYGEKEGWHPTPDGIYSPDGTHKIDLEAAKQSEALKTGASLALKEESMPTQDDKSEKGKDANQNANEEGAALQEIKDEVKADNVKS